MQFQNIYGYGGLSAKPQVVAWFFSAPSGGRFCTFRREMPFGNDSKNLAKCSEVSENVKNLLKTHKISKKVLAGRTDRPTDRQSDLQSRVHVTKKGIKQHVGNNDDKPYTVEPRSNGLESRIIKALIFSFTFLIHLVVSFIYFLSSSFQGINDQLVAK